MADSQSGYYLIVFLPDGPGNVTGRRVDGPFRTLGIARVQSEERILQYSYLHPGHREIIPHSIPWLTGPDLDLYPPLPPVLRREESRGPRAK